MEDAASPGHPIDEKRKTVEKTKEQEKAPKDDAADETSPAKRKDSRAHVGETSQLGDVSELVRDGPPPLKKKQSEKPGSLANEHADAETNLLRETKTRFADGPIHQNDNGERTESDDGKKSHGGNYDARQ